MNPKKAKNKDTNFKNKKRVNLPILLHEDLWYNLIFKS